VSCPGLPHLVIQPPREAPEPKVTNQDLGIGLPLHFALNMSKSNLTSSLEAPCLVLLTDIHAVSLVNGLLTPDWIVPRVCVLEQLIEGTGQAVKS
jgi:hypothetical protein